MKSMSLLEAKKDYMKRGVYDEMYTPQDAVQCVLPYIPQEIKKIWEPTAFGENNITLTLKNNLYEVIGTHIFNQQDYFVFEPDDYDMIITNPPYSLKDKFLQRAFELDKPFMFLLPLTTLEGIKRGKMFSQYDIQLIIPNKRFNFKPEKNSGAWFQTTWFTYKCNLPKTLNFINVI